MQRRTGAGSADIATSPITGLSTNFSYNFPAYSANVIAFGAGGVAFANAYRDQNTDSNGDCHQHTDHHANSNGDFYCDCD